jgi:hypothetical protein
MSGKVKDLRDVNIGRSGDGKRGNVSGSAAKQKSGATAKTNAGGTRRLRAGELDGLVLSQMRKSETSCP